MQSGKVRPATAPVWQSSSDYAPTNVEYHCDAKLGTPKPADCLDAKFRIAGQSQYLEIGH